MLTAIFLHGHLAQKYGKRFDLDVESVAGAIALLKANFAHFARDVIGQGERYRVWVGKTNIGADELQSPANGQDIHIVPVVAGAGGNGSVFQIIVGVILVVVGVVLMIFDMPWGAYLIDAGMMMIEGGIIGLVFSAFQHSKRFGSESTMNGEQKVSRYFNGAVNTTAQGNPVPILYGQLRIGSQVISGGFSDEDV